MDAIDRLFLNTNPLVIVTVFSDFIQVKSPNPLSAEAMKTIEKITTIDGVFKSSSSNSNFLIHCYCAISAQDIAKVMCATWASTTNLNFEIRQQSCDGYKIIELEN